MRNIASSFFRYHRRLGVAILVGILFGVLVPGRWSAIERPLLGWNATLWCYLVLLWWMMLREKYEGLRGMADREDESAVTVLFSVTLVTLASIAAIVFELATTKGAPGDAQKSLHIILSSITLLGGWLLVPTVFTIHYARMYFVSGDQAPVFRFPEEKVQPDYLDFAYFAFTIAVASQTSDVAVASSRARRFTLLQSVLAYFFNLAIMGLSINIAAGFFS